MSPDEEIRKFMKAAGFYPVKSFDQGEPGSALDGKRQYYISARQMGVLEGSVGSPPNLFVEVELYVTDGGDYDLASDINNVLPDNWLLVNDGGVAVEEEFNEQVINWHLYTCILRKVG